jgi:pyruvyl transferase EpsO
MTEDAGRHAGAAAAHAATLAARVTQAIAATGGAADGTPWALLDFPNHRNIGDSAIWVGEMALLRALHRSAPAYVSIAHYPVEEIGRFIPQGTLYLHGGGNFGDLWPGHQRYREAVIARYPGHRIVQLPQSTQFRDPEGVVRARRAIDGHRDFHMMVRDRRSLEFIRATFACPVALVPDSAFGIDMARFPRTVADGERGLRALLREDHEQRPDAAAARALFAGVPVEDWRQPRPATWLWSRRALKLAGEGPRRLPLPRAWMALRIATLDRIAAHLVGIGFAQLREAGVLVTDRLHGHIMASLAGVPHVALDNVYGKISGFMEAWGAVPFAARAQDYATARRIAEDLLDRARG